MASITIRNLDDGLKRRLRVRAAENGRSMEEEAMWGSLERTRWERGRRSISDHMVGAPPPADLGRAIHARFAALGGVELELPERGPMRPPPSSTERAPWSS